MRFTWNYLDLFLANLLQQLLNIWIVSAGFEKKNWFSLIILYSVPLQAHSNKWKMESTTEHVFMIIYGAIWHDLNLIFTLNWYWPKSPSCQLSKKSDWIRNQFWFSLPDSYKKWVRERNSWNKTFFFNAADQSAACDAGGERKEGSLENLCHMS